MKALVLARETGGANNCDKISYDHRRLCATAQKQPLNDGVISSLAWWPGTGLRNGIATGSTLQPNEL